MNRPPESDATDMAAIGVVLQKLAEIGITIILIEHDMELVMCTSGHVIVLDAGRKNRRRAAGCYR